MTSVDLILICFLSVLFVVQSLRLQKGQKAAGSYIGANGSLRLGSGTVCILAFWITGNTLMAAPESTYDIGVLGSVGYALIGGIALMAFAPFARRIRFVVPNGKTIGDFFASRFGVRSYTLLLAMQLFYGIGVLVTQGVAGETALHEIAGLPQWLGLALVLLVAMAYTAIGGFSSVVKVGYLQVFIILTATLLVPSYIFFTLGIHDVFRGIQVHAIHALDLHSSVGIAFASSGIVMGIGEVFMDNAFWQRTYALHQKSVFPAFMISGFTWMLIPLAVSTLSFAALGVNLHPNPANNTAPLVASAVGGRFIGALFLVAVWSAITSTVGGFLNSIVSFLLHDVYHRVRPHAGERETTLTARTLTVLIGITVFSICLTQQLSMIHTLTFLGVMNAAFIAPIAIGLFTVKLTDGCVATAILSSIAVGYAVFYTYGPALGIACSFGMGSLVCGTFYLFRISRSTKYMAGAPRN